MKNIKNETKCGTEFSKQNFKNKIKVEETLGMENPYHYRNKHNISRNK